MFLAMIVVGLAAWRISAMLSYESGPLDIFLKAREALGFEHSESGEPTAWPQGLLQQILSCVWCLGVWSALLMWGVWVLEPTLVYILASMAVVVAMERVARRG